MAVPDGQEPNLDAIRTAEETIRIGLTWVPDKHAVAPTDALATLLAALTQLQADLSKARVQAQRVPGLEKALSDECANSKRIVDERQAFIAHAVESWRQEAEGFEAEAAQLRAALDATRAREIADEIMASISVVADDREWMRGQLTRSATEGLSEAAQLRAERDAAVKALAGLDEPWTWIAEHYPKAMREMPRNLYGRLAAARAALAPAPEAETTT